MTRPVVSFEVLYRGYTGVTLGIAFEDIDVSFLRQAVNVDRLLYIN